MTTSPSADAARLSRRRWDRPDNVDRRVDALANHIRKVTDTLPPLTDEQRARLAALLRPSNMDGAAA